MGAVDDFGNLLNNVPYQINTSLPSVAVVADVANKQNDILNAYLFFLFIIYAMLIIDLYYNCAQNSSSNTLL